MPPKYKPRSVSEATYSARIRGVAASAAIASCGEAAIHSVAMHFSLSSDIAERRMEKRDRVCIDGMGVMRVHTVCGFSTRVRLPESLNLGNGMKWRRHHVVTLD